MLFPVSVVILGSSASRCPSGSLIFEFISFIFGGENPKSFWLSLCTLSTPPTNSFSCWQSCMLGLYSCAVKGRVANCRRITFQFGGTETVKESSQGCFTVARQKKTQEQPGFTRGSRCCLGSSLHQEAVIFSVLTLVDILLSEGCVFHRGGGGLFDPGQSVWWGQPSAVAEARWTVPDLPWQCLGKVT